MLSDIHVEHGPAAQAYFNSALVEIEAMNSHWRKNPPDGRSYGKGVSKLMSLQVTGGSTSTIDAFEKMRAAGATARDFVKGGIK